MEIKNKEIFKAEIVKKVNKYIKQFPFYFYGNIITNIILVAIIIIAVFFVVASWQFSTAIFFYGPVSIAFVSSILRITVKDFLKNIKTLEKIKAGHYDFGVEDYELDNAVEFLEELPKPKEEVDQMKGELSFGKLVDVFEATNIISYENGLYNIDRIFRAQTEAVMEGKQMEYL